MRKQLWTPAALGLALLLAFSVRASAASPKGQALRKRAEAFVEAFDKGDARALAAFWTADGDYVDEAGRAEKGREAIEAAYQKVFADNKGAKLHLTVTSLRMVNPDLAIEDGVSEVVFLGDRLPASARYTVVHVQQEGQWYLASVREAPAVPPSQYEHLQDLEWLIGDWTDEAEKGEGTRASFSWAEHQNFIIGNIDTTLQDVPVTGVTQWIGWDPAGKHIRSWAFEHNGGFGEGVWARDGNRLTITRTGTLPDGQKLAATSIVTNIDADHLTWQSVKRSLGGKPLPDLPEVKMKRVK